MAGFCTPLSPLSLPSPSVTLVQGFHASPPPQPAYKYAPRGFPVPKRAGAPWDSADADLVLRSAEDVEFRVHRAVIARVLAAFDISSLSARGGEQELSDDGLPLLRLHDSADTLAALLDTIYASPTPLPPDLPALRGVLVSLERYGARFVPSSVRSALEAAVADTPEQVYVLACVAGLHDLARAAARASLRAPRQLAPVPRADLGLLTALQYHALVVYQDEARTAALGAASNLAWMCGDDVPGAAPSEPDRTTLGCGCAAVHEQTLKQKGSGVPPYFLVPEWVGAYMRAVGDALGGEVRGAVARRPAAMLPALRGAYACKECGDALDARFAAFSDALAREIERRIDEVQLQVDP